MNALEAVEKLSHYDHGILKREGALAIWEAMGLDGRSLPLYVIEHDPHSIKGARLDGCTEPGEKRMGIGADDLAVHACVRLKVEFASKFGRGSQLRECVRALHQHFTAKGTPSD